MLKKLLIDIRDHAFHYSMKQNGIDAARNDYIIKFFAMIAFYYIGILILIGNLVSFSFNFQELGQNSSLIRLLLSLSVAAIPIWILIKVALNTIKNIPIPEKLSPKEYNRKKNIALSVLVAGVIFFLFCCVLPVYFSGGKVHIGKYVIQRKL